MSEHSPWYETVVIPALLRHARTAYGKAMRAALDAAGCDDIPGNGLYVIGGLALGAGDVPLGVLIRDLGVSKQAAGQLVDTLVLRGYLVRAEDPQDRRRTTITLTARGQQAAEVQAKARDAIDQELIATVGAEDVCTARKVLGALCDMGRRGESEDS